MHREKDPDPNCIMELRSNHERGKMLLDTISLSALDVTPTGSLIKLFNIVADRCSMPRHSIELVVRAKEIPGARPDWVKVLNQEMVCIESPFKALGPDHDARIKRAYDDATEPDMSESDKEVLFERKRAEADELEIRNNRLLAGDGQNLNEILDILDQIKNDVEDRGSTQSETCRFSGLRFIITDKTCAAPAFSTEAIRRTPTSLTLGLKATRTVGKTKLTAAMVSIRLAGGGDDEWRQLVDVFDTSEWTMKMAHVYTVRIAGLAQRSSDFKLEEDTQYEIKSTFIYETPGIGLQESDAVSCTIRTAPKKAPAQRAAAAAVSPRGAAAVSGSAREQPRNEKGGRVAGGAPKRRRAAAAAAPLPAAAAVAPPQPPLQMDQVNLMALESAQLLCTLQKMDGGSAHRFSRLHSALVAEKIDNVQSLFDQDLAGLEEMGNDASDDSALKDLQKKPFRRIFFMATQRFKDAQPAHAPRAAATGPGNEGEVCPITQQPFVKKARAADGHMYEEWAIECWLMHHDNSPLTGLPMPNKTLSAV